MARHYVCLAGEPELVFKIVPFALLNLKAELLCFFALTREQTSAEYLRVQLALRRGV